MKVSQTQYSDYQIKCGQCSCEYKPRLKYYSCEKYKNEQAFDYSCPQCGFGQKKDKKKVAVQEEANSKKQLLLD